MKIRIEAVPDCEQERLTMERMGRETMEQFVLDSGARMIAKVVGQIGALGVKADPSGKWQLMMRASVDVEKVNFVDSYQHLVDAATGETPGLDELGFREYGAWIEREISYQVMYPMQGCDFARLDEGDQRTQLLLAAEILYGPERDGDMLGEAVFWAKEPV